MKVLNPPATVHGRVLVERAEGAVGIVAGFHGYAQTAEDMLVELRQIPGAERWTKVSIQALHPFYIRGDSKVVASWMTRQDRDLAIADNIAYVQTVIAQVLMEHAPMERAGFSPRVVPGAEAPGLHRVAPGLQVETPGLHQVAAGLHVVMVGFSQGAAIAYRAALRSAHPVAGIVALGGDIPPELKEDTALTWPPVLIGVGDREAWYVGDKLDADLTFLRSRGITHELVRFDGGHEWTAGFRDAVGRFIASPDTSGTTGV